MCEQGPQTGLDAAAPRTLASITDVLYNDDIMNDPLSVSLSALADPTRRAILARLAMGEASVTELARPFGMSQPAISRHLKVLETAGLIETRQSAQERPRRLKPGALDEVAVWLSRLRNMWGESFDRLDEFLGSEDQPDGKGV